MESLNLATEIQSYGKSGANQYCQINNYPNSVENEIDISTNVIWSRNWIPKARQKSRVENQLNFDLLD